MENKDLFENEGYILGYSPRDRQIREERETVTKRASAIEVPHNGVVIGRNPKEQTERLYRLLSDGDKHTTVDITDNVRIADPRAVIRELRKKGIAVCDEWCKANGKRFKRYWIRS
jgi:hypothetical protein